MPGGDNVSESVRRVIETHGQQVVSRVKPDGTPGIGCVSCSEILECTDVCPLRQVMVPVRRDFDWLAQQEAIAKEQKEEGTTDMKTMRANIEKFSVKYSTHMDPSQNLAGALKRDGTLKAMIDKADWARQVVREETKEQPKLAILQERAVDKFIRGKWADILVDEGQLLANTFPEIEAVACKKEKLCVEAVDIVVGMLMMVTAAEGDVLGDIADEGDEGETTDEGDETEQGDENQQGGENQQVSENQEGGENQQ